MRHALVILVGLPFAAAIVQSVLRVGSRALTITASVAASLIAFFLVVKYNPVGDPSPPHVFSVPWIEYFNISFNLGLDGLSVFPLLLVAVVLPTLVLLYGAEHQGAKGKRALLLLLQSALFGVVCARDLFLLFFFWTFSVAPTYFYLVVWGDKNRVEAGMRYLVFSAIGSLLMILAFLMIYLGVEPHTFVLQGLGGERAVALARESVSVFGQSISMSMLAFGLVTLGIGFRAGLWPFHQWLYRLGEEAPAPVLVTVTGLMIPLSAYVFSRLGLELFSTELNQIAPIVTTIGVVNLCIGAFYSVGQKNLRGVLVSLSLVQVGVLLIGIGSEDMAGLMGASFHGFGSGLSLAALAMLIGMIVARTKNADLIDEKGNPVFGGLVQAAPVFTSIAAIVFCSSVGMPGFAGYIGSALVWMGGTKSNPNLLIAGIAGGVLVLVSMVTVFRHMFLGSGRGEGEFREATALERGAFVPMLAAILGMGLFPSAVLELIRPTIQTFLSLIKP